MPLMVEIVVKERFEDKMKFDVKNKVKEYYGGIAKKVESGATSCCCGSSCCDDMSKTSMIYKGEDLSSLPNEALEGSLGCANPIPFAKLKEGETVLDLGSGGGINVLMAAKAVGETGSVYGLDMTDEMLALAKKNKVKMGIKNVDFIKGYIEDIPLKDELIDVIISNCVINLSDDKEKALSEAYRVLKKGGRLAIADIIRIKEIPKDLKDNSDMWCGCLGGAITKQAYHDILEKVGFKNIEIKVEHIYTKEMIDTNVDSIDKAFVGAYIKAYK